MRYTCEVSISLESCLREVRQFRLSPIKVIDENTLDVEGFIGPRTKAILKKHGFTSAVPEVTEIYHCDISGLDDGDIAHLLNTSSVIIYEADRDDEPTIYFVRA